MRHEEPERAVSEEESDSGRWCALLSMEGPKLGTGTVLRREPVETGS